jgi:oligoendopeptidase F
MKPLMMWLMLALLPGMTGVPTASAEGRMTKQERERSGIPESHKWNLTDLYGSSADWERDFARLNKEVKAFARCRGKLGGSVKRLGDCLDDMFALTKRLYRLSVYAMRLHDQDLGVPAGQGLKDRIQKAGTEVSAALAFVEPGILKIPPARLKKYLTSPRLADYKHFVHNITRRRAHILSPSEEELVARAGNLSAVPMDTYRTLSTVNLPWPEIELKSGEKVTLNQAMYTKLRATPDRQDREKVFMAFFASLGSFRESFATLLAGAVSRDRYYSEVRGYKTDLHAALDDSNVPVGIYHNMIKQVRAGLPQLWRYLKLRKKLLRIETLGYHDLYTSMVPSVRMEVPYERAKELMLASLAPMGEEYVRVLENGFEQRWADVYPTRNKRSGAYMSGSAYDVHPYVLLNYNDDYESMSTAAHEFGHALHSHFSNTTQPFPMCDYPIFVAEVASTVNEQLLRLYLTGIEKDPKKKLFILGQELENYRTVVFRQALFAEFELKIHEMAQAGEPLTAEKLDQTYLELLREYYGEAEGVIQIDPRFAVEWAYIPHFYYNFYMFQYTTSFIASTAISQKIHGGDRKARDNYLKMLRAGGSRYPVQLLKMAGMDMAGAEPYKKAFQAMADTMDEIEALIQNQ